MTGFTPAFAYLLSAMIVWVTFFMGSYGLVAVICAVGFPWAISGMPPTHLGLAAATLLALGITSILVIQAARRSTNVDGVAKFTATMVILQGVVAAIAIAWNVLPLVFLEGCGLQELPRL